MTDQQPTAAPIYQELGIKRVINAADTYTALGGGRLHSTVIDAMTQAGAHHVDAAEVLQAVGRRLAQRLDVPAVHVVNGAAAGLTIAAAACIGGTDPAGVGLLPHVRSDRNEIVVLRCQRNSYDRALLPAGARIVEVGYADSTPMWSVEAALSERTAAIVYYPGDQFERFAPSLAEMANVARAATVPLIVDAAAQLPPVSNLWEYHRAGGDLVLFSGGKGLRGPQSSGLIIGDADLVRACAANSYPNHSVGRAMKTSKENALGLLAAVERALDLDWDAEYQRWMRLLESYAARLDQLGGLRHWIVPTGRLGQMCPRLFVDVGPVTGLSAGQLDATLMAADPAIAVGLDRPDTQEIFINPYSILVEEEDALIETLLAVLKEALPR